MLFKQQVEFTCFFFKQKTAYEMRISDWSSDVCSSDLAPSLRRNRHSRAACGAARGPRDTIRCARSRRRRDGRRRRSEERLVGEECVRTCRYRRSPDHYKKKTQIQNARLHTRNLNQNTTHTEYANKQHH